MSKIIIKNESNGDIIYLIEQNNNILGLGKKPVKDYRKPKVKLKIK